MSKLKRLALSSDRIFACDTEVMNIDLSSESPCGHGDVICFSIYCGDDADFSTRKEPSGQRAHLWVDLLDASAFEAGKQLWKTNIMDVATVVCRFDCTIFFFVWLLLIDSCLVFAVNYDQSCYMND